MKRDIDLANSRMRWFIKEGLNDLFGEHFTIELVERYYDDKNMLTADVFAKVIGSDNLFCFTFAPAEDLEPSIVIKEDPKTFGEPTKENVYAFAMLALDDMCRSLQGMAVEMGHVDR